jgi:hypothetical protein
MIDISFGNKVVGRFNQDTKEFYKFVKRENILRIDNSIGFSRGMIEDLQPDTIIITIDDGRIFSISYNDYMKFRKPRRFASFEPQDFVPLKYFDLIGRKA